MRGVDFITAGIDNDFENCYKEKEKKWGGSL